MLIKKFLQNSVAIGASFVIDKILYLIFYVYLARVLGDVAVGKFSFALAFTFLFSILIDFGFGSLLVKDIARDKSKAQKYLSNIIMLRGILSALALLMIVIIINLMKDDADSLWLVYIIGFYTVLNSNTGTFTYTFRAFQEMHYMAFVNVLERILVIGTSIFLIYRGCGLIPVAICFLSGGLFSLLLSSCIVRKKFVTFTLEADLDFWKFLIKNSIPYALNAIAIAIFIRIDTVMLSMFKGDAVVGWYSVAHSLVYAALMIPFTYGIVLFPVYSQYYNQSQYLKFAFEKSFKIFLFIGLGLSIFVSVYSDSIILTIFGEKFVNSIIILTIMIWVSTFLFFRYIYITMLGAIDKQVIVMKILIFLALLNIAMNALLIPPFSYTGAIVATLVTEVVGVCTGFYYIYKLIPGITIRNQLPKAVITACLFTVFLLMLHQCSLSIFTVIPIVIAVYLLILILLRIFDSEEIGLLKAALGGKFAAQQMRP